MAKNKFSNLDSGGLHPATGVWDGDEGGYGSSSIENKIIREKGTNQKNKFHTYPQIIGSQIQLLKP